MTRPWILESLDAVDLIDAGAPSPYEALLEEERLQAFDRGYKDGWDDAARAHAEEQDTISAELAGNLQELSFTYHEARHAVLAEMETILKGLVSKVLPATMVDSLGRMIVEQILSVADDASEIDVDIVVCPENVERVRHVLKGKVAPPLNVHGENSLGEGQAFLRIGNTEQKIDLENLFHGLSEAIGEFFDETEYPEVRHA